MQRSKHIRTQGCPVPVCMSTGFPFPLMTQRGEEILQGWESFLQSATGALCGLAVHLVHDSPGEVTAHSFRLAEAFLEALEDGVAFDC